jgi:YfiH family protein
MEEALRFASVPALEAVPGLVHGFERRRGAAFEETRAEGRARVAQALAPSGRLHLLRQVHGCAVRTAPWEGTPEADASTASSSGDLLGVETADCLPVLLADPVRRAAGAAHAGWRGTVARVAAAVVAAMVEAGSRPSDLLAALGPSIGACCYEVGPDVQAAFGPEGARFFRPGPRGRAHVDVRAANRAQLVAAGLPDDAIHDVLDCTYCTPGYFSYRRDGQGAGRMINFVGWRQ